jgi:hypothetical protein
LGVASPRSQLKLMLPLRVQVALVVGFKFLPWELPKRVR